MDREGQSHVLNEYSELKEHNSKHAGNMYCELLNELTLLPIRQTVDEWRMLEQGAEDKQRVGACSGQRR